MINKQFTQLVRDQMIRNPTTSLTHWGDAILKLNTKKRLGIKLDEHEHMFARILSVKNLFDKQAISQERFIFFLEREEYDCIIKFSGVIVQACVKCA